MWLKGFTFVVCFKAEVNSTLNRKEIKPAILQEEPENLDGRTYAFDEPSRKATIDDHGSAPHSVLRE